MPRSLRGEINAWVLGLVLFLVDRSLSLTVVRPVSFPVGAEPGVENVERALRGAARASFVGSGAGMWWVPGPTPLGPLPNAGKIHVTDAENRVVKLLCISNQGGVWWRA